MMGILSRHGYELTPHADQAEVLVVNTCSFIEAAQQESVNAILEMAEYKKSGKARRLVVAGCLVERYRRQIREQIPEVDAVIGTGDIEQIIQAVEGTAPASGPCSPQLPVFLYHEAMPRVLATPGHAAYIKIAEGCDHPCSFCIIPQLRGNFRSRRFESVIREAENLAAAGVREITLIGQDTTSYGQDLGLRDALPDLLARLAQIQSLQWVRFLYAYPHRVTQKLLDTIAAHPRLVKYLDMPLQHASRNVLARMKRGSNGGAFLRLIERIRATIPGVMLRSSFITGFPGESPADFKELCDFLRAAELDWAGVFAYSDVDTAASHALDHKVDPDTTAERRGHLMALQRRISARRLLRFKGQTLPALVEGPSRENDLVWEARIEGMAPEIDGKLFLTDIQPHSGGRPAVAGDMAVVQIAETHDYDLIGRVVRINDPLPARWSPSAPMPRIATGAPLRILA